MSEKNMKVGLLIKTGTEGTEKIIDLSEAINAAGIEANHLSDEGKELAQTFGEIERQQGLIDHFRKLEAQLEKTGQELDELAIKNERVGEGAGGNYTQQQQRLKKLTKWQESLNKELDETVTAMNAAGIATDKLTAHEEKLARQAQKAARSVDKLTKEANELKAIGDARIKLGITDQDKINKELAETTRAYNLLKKSGTLSSTELANANRLHAKKVMELEQQLKGLKPTLSDVRGELTKSAGAGAAFTLIAREAMQFESAMAGVKKVVDGTPEQMEELSGTIKQLAYDLGMTAEETANIAAMGGQLGVAFGDLPQFTRLAGEMSVAFGITAEEAGNAAAKMANVWGLPLEQVRELGDAINTLGNNTAAKEAEITAAMLRIGGNAKQFGLAAEEAAALADAMIALGKPPEVAATAINALLLKLQTAETLGAKAQGALKDIGFSATEMANNIQQNPQKAINDFITKLGEMDKQARAVALAELFGSEYADDISLLVAGSESLAAAFDLVGDKAKNSGALNKEFATQMNNAEAKINQAQTAVSNLASTLGQNLLPIISKTAISVGGVANAISDVAAEYPQLTQLALLLTGAKIATIALNTTLKLLGREGVKSFAEIAAAAKNTTSAIIAGEKQLISYGRSARTLGGDVRGLGKRLMSLNGILSSITAFDIGSAIGNSLYEAFDSVKAVGDELGRIVAYVDAIFTERTFDDVSNNFETFADVQKRLADNAEKANQRIAEQNRLRKESENAEKQRQSLVEQTLQTYSELINSKNELEKLGLKESQHYEYLVGQIDALKPSAEAYKNEIIETGKFLDNTATEARKVDEAFESVGLSLNELTTGITDAEQKVINGVGNIVTHIKSVGGESKHAGEMLERYFVSASSKIKTPEGLEAFHKKFTEIADAAGFSAEKIKEMTDTVSPAFAKLGVDVDAVMNGISDSAETSMSNFASAMEAAQQSGTNSMKLTQAAIDAVLKTLNSPEEFKAFDEQLKNLGIRSKATAEQLTAINEGRTKSTNEATEAVKKQNTVAKESVDVSKESAEATSQQVEAMKAAAEEAQGASEALNQWIDSQKDSIRSIKEMGLSVEEVNGLLNSFDESLSFNNIMHPSDVKGFMIMVQGLTKSIKRQGEELAQTKQKAVEWTESLSSATASTQDLFDAQVALDAAMGHVVDIAGSGRDAIVRIDETTLDNLQNAIDETKNRLKEMGETARQEAEDLQAQLAKLRGDDDLSRQLEEKRKLAALEEKLAAARKRNNQEEIEAYQEAINYQKQIFAEKEKQYNEEKRQQAEREKSRNERKERREEPTRSSGGSGGAQFDAGKLSKEFKQSFDSSINQIDLSNLMRDLGTGAGKQLIQQMRDEASRMAR